MKARKYTVALAVTEYDHQRLQAYAVRKGTTLTTLVRRWLNHGLDHENIELLEPMSKQPGPVKPRTTHPLSRWKKEGDAGGQESRP